MIKWLSAPSAPTYSILGDWRAESTQLLGYQLPIGLNLRFGESSAYLLDQEVAISEYDYEGDRVTVVVKPAQLGAQLSLTFVFEDSNRMYFEGPVGLTLRYKRTNRQTAR